MAARIDQSAAVTAERAEAALGWRRRAGASLDEETSPTRFVLTPTVPALDKRIGDDLIEGEHFRRVLSWFTAPVNHAGHPALSVPVAGAGRTASVQLIGPKWSETRLAAVGLLLRQAGLVGPAIQSSDSE